MEKVEKVRSKEGRFAMSKTRILNKAVTTTLILLLTLSMLGIFASNIGTVNATAYDLTPEYAKAGATIDILNFTIVGPTGGTTLTSVTVAYTGTALEDLSHASVYVSTDGGASWTLFGWAWAASFTGSPLATTITGSYTIGEDVTATVKLTFKLSSNPTHGDTVDGEIVTYGLTVPPGDGTDAPPIDPAGETTIDTSEPTVTLIYPAGDEELKGEETIAIAWSATDNNDFTGDDYILINLEYSPNGGVDWILIASNEENDGVYEWTLPTIDSDSVLVRVWAFDLAGNSGSDTSDPFTIDSTSPTISDLTPEPGSYVNNTTPTISAVLSNGLSGINPNSITIEVDGADVTDYAVWEWIEEPYGTLTYTPTEDLGEGEHTVYVYVEDDAGNSADATWSFTVDTIAPVVEVIQPDGGEELIGEETYEIMWTAEDLNLAPNPITIEYSTDGGVTWNLIASNLPNTGSYEWVVPGVVSDNVFVRVSAADLAGNVGSDTSDAPFSITYIPVVTTVMVSASSTVVPADGVTESTITATVLDQCNNPMEGVTVTFTTTLGTLSNGTATGTTVTATTDEDGVATVTLTSTTRGIATVTATADSISDTVEVEFYGAAGIEDVIAMLEEIKAKLETLPDIPSLIDAAKNAILSAISGAQSAIIAAINSAKADILVAISGLDVKLNAIQADLSDIKAAIAPPMVIEGTEECPTKGSVVLFDVDKTEMAGRFKVSFTIDATELDSGDRVYVQVYVKATAESSPVLAKQVLVYGRTGADPREVYMDSLVNAEQVTVQLKWYYGTTSDDPIHFQAVISSP
jgi:hypothetical protein